jgi:hypothetical protein
VSSGVWIVIVVAVVVALAIAVAVRRRAAHNSVDSFRRQIDALGPAARRTVVDQVQTAASRDPDTKPEPPKNEPDPDEGGTRGS